MTVSWTDIQKWDLAHMRAQYDELANQLNHLGDSQTRMRAAGKLIGEGWEGPAGSEAYLGAMDAADSMDHAKQMMDKLKAAADAGQEYVQKAKEAQAHAEDLAKQKQYEIDPYTTELHDLAVPDPNLFKDLSALAQYAMKRQQDALEVRNAVNEALRLGEEAEQFCARAIDEAVGETYTPPEKQDREFYPDQLYGKDGKPSSGDTVQGGGPMGDCTVVSTLAAMADADPESIKKMIHYDPRTGNYDVTFTNKDGTTKTVSVTEAELRANVKVGGGSRVDNGDPNAPLWPAVIETAYAKTMPPTDKSKLDENQRKTYDELHKQSPQYGELFYRIAHGAYPPESLGALTGKPVDHYDQKAAIDPNNVAKVQQAIANHQPVIVSTHDGNKLSDGSPDYNDPRNRDGVANGHAFQVQEVHIDPNTHHVMATVRNPWGNNDTEGHSGVPATMQVDLTTLQDTGSLGSVDVAGK